MIKNMPLEQDEHTLRRLLLGVPPWLIERYSIDGARVTLSGWALPPDGNPSNWSFLINGRVPDRIKYPLSTPSLAQVFPFCVSSEMSGFEISFDIIETDHIRGFAEIEFVSNYTKYPSYSYFTQYIDFTMSENLKIPDGEQLFRTQGNRSPERYKLHGFTTYKRIETILFRHSGKTIDEYRSILDWGCGCGRLSQQLALRLAEARVLGIDIDGPNIEWCQQNIPKATFQLVELQPPTTLTSSSFDLIIGISVMTHLDLASQTQWLRELQRLSEPKGYIILTTHGESALARVKNFETIRNTLSDGSDDNTADASLDKTISARNYYRSTYHLRNYVKENFQEYFDVIDILPASNASLQDFVILRGR